MISQVTPTPIAMPPIATQKKVPTASTSEKRAGQGGGDGKAHADEAGRVVEQRFALEDVHQPVGDRHAGGNRRNRDRIGRRDDGGQREGDGERHRGEQQVDQQADAEHGEDDEAERQLEDDALVAQQAFLGDAPAIEKQQRRQEQQEEQVRIERDAEIGDGGDDDAEGDLHERRRNRYRREPGECSAHDHRKQQDQRNADAFHEIPIPSSLLAEGSVCAVFWPWWQPRRRPVSSCCDTGWARALRPT
jgi:hypothetical protein